jgi:hypothetical protein
MRLETGEITNGTRRARVRNAVSRPGQSQSRARGSGDANAARFWTQEGSRHLHRRYTTPGRLFVSPVIWNLDSPQAARGQHWADARDLGEQFCTDDFCQEVQARMSGHGECWCRKQISTGNTLERRCFWPATPKPAKISRICLSLPGPGRKLHYRVDPDRLATSVSRDQLKRRSLGQAHWLLFSYASSVAERKQLRQAARKADAAIGRCARWGAARIIETPG